MEYEPNSCGDNTIKQIGIIQYSVFIIKGFPDALWLANGLLLHVHSYYC